MIDHTTAVSETLSCNSMEHYARSQEKKTKRCKTIEAFSSGSSDVGNDSVGSSSYCLEACRKIYKEKICSGSSYPLEIPCITVSCKETPFNCRKDNANITSSFNSGIRKILLEFNLDSFCKFQVSMLRNLQVSIPLNILTRPLIELAICLWLLQSLKIGGYYIIKHHKEDCYCTTNYSEILGSSKIGITSRTTLLSISFSSQKALLETDRSDPT